MRVFRKVLHVAVFGLIAIGLPVISKARADLSRCTNIASDDLRRFCIAQRTGNVSECYVIRDNAQRRFCIAKLTGNVGECASIMDSDARNYCRSIVGR